MKDRSAEALLIAAIHGPRETYLALLPKSRRRIESGAVAGGRSRPDHFVLPNERRGAEPRRSGRLVRGPLLPEETGTK